MMRDTLGIPTTVRPATDGDAAEMSLALSEAFHDDPVFRWVSPDAARRRSWLPGFFAIFAETYIPLGETYVTEGGAAMWVAAGVDPFADQDDEAFGARIAELVGPDAERSGSISKAIDEHHPHEPAAYLHFVGVEPDRQGRGLGSALMAPVLATCDRDRVPAYLVATSRDSRRLYERQGFTTISEIIAAPGAPPVWGMWRDPASG